MKKLTALLSVLLLGISLCACGGTSNVSSTGDETATDITTVDSSDMFTSRDLDASYDESTAEKITLSDSVMKITKAGTYIISGSCTDGTIEIDAADADKIQLVLKNAALASKSCALLIKNADKVFITPAEGTTNSISDGSSYTLAEGDAAVDAAIFSKCDLTINGSGTLSVNGNYKHGIVSKDDLVITGGTIAVTSASCGIEGKDSVRITKANITVKSGTDGIRSTNEEDQSKGFIYIESGSVGIAASHDGIQAESAIMLKDGTFNITSGGGTSNAQIKVEASPRAQYNSTAASDADSTKGIKSAGNIVISGGIYTVDSADDAIHSNSEIDVTGGSFTLKTGDDGVHADNVLKVSGGELTVSQSYEGLEAGEINISGGNINITASDDGLNAAGGSDSSDKSGPGGGDPFASDSSKKLCISGGKLIVNADGDGLDSNGAIEISGGITLVSGPSNDGNGSLDYGSNAKVTGGIVIATGSSGMAETFTESTQGVIMTDVTSQNANSSIALCDEDGNVLLSYTPQKKYTNIVLSAPTIKNGGSYNIVCGGTVSDADENGYAESGTVSGGSSVATISMSSLNYRSGGQSSMGGGRPNDQGGKRPNGKPYA